MENERPQIVPFKTINTVEKFRGKTSLRSSYEDQVELIKVQIGDLEKVRMDLGLSQRQISRLLMIDPSSWTRWTKHGAAAPPHIYRALQWLMIIKEKLPGLSVIPAQNQSNAHLASQLDARFFEQQMKEEVKKREEGLDKMQLTVLEMQNRMQGQNQLIKTLIFAVLLLIGVIIGRLVKALFIPSI